jgi:hypothetical protein
LVVGIWYARLIAIFCVDNDLFSYLIPEDLEMKFRNVMRCALAVLFTAGVSMADGPVGTWKMEIPQGVHILTITGDEDDLKGKALLGDTTQNLRSTSFFEGRISFSFDVQHEGQTVGVVYTGTLNDGVFKGTIISGTVGSFNADLVPTAPIVDFSPVLGSWDGETEQGPFVVVLTQNEKGLAGIIESDLGTTELTDLAFEDGKLTFELSIDLGGQMMELSFSGSVSDGAFDGEVVIPDVAEIPLTMTRTSAPADLSAAAGRWEGMTDNGPVALIVSNEGGYLKAQIETGLGTQDVEGLAFLNGKLSFSTTLDIGGQPLNLQFDGPIEGDTYSSQISIDGVGEFPLEFTREASGPPEAEKVPAPDIVMQAVQDWEALPAHIRTTIETLIEGEIGDKK